MALQSGRRSVMKRLRSKASVTAPSQMDMNEVALVMIEFQNEFASEGRRPSTPPYFLCPASFPSSFSFTPTLPRLSPPHPTPHSDIPQVARCTTR